MKFLKTLLYWDFCIFILRSFAAGKQEETVPRAYKLEEDVDVETSDTPPQFYLWLTEGTGDDPTMQTNWCLFLVISVKVAPEAAVRMITA